MRIIILLASLLALSGCYWVIPATLGGAEVASKSYTDKWLIEHIAIWADKKCENYTHYDSPVRCRND